MRSLSAIFIYGVWAILADATPAVAQALPPQLPPQLPAQLPTQLQARPILPPTGSAQQQPYQPQQFTPQFASPAQAPVIGSSTAPSSPQQISPQLPSTLQSPQFSPQLQLAPALQPLNSQIVTPPLNTPQSQVLQLPSQLQPQQRLQQQLQNQQTLPPPFDQLIPSAPTQIIR